MRDGNVVLRNCLTAQPVAAFSCEGAPTANFTSGGRLLVIRSGAETLYCDGHDGTVIWKALRQPPALVDPTETLVAVPGEERNGAGIWEIKTNRRVVSFEDEGRPVHPKFFSKTVL